MSSVVVIGAGVSGLTTAVTLLQSGYKDVKVVAKHIPGDLTTEYTSPWAGASILTFASEDDTRLQKIDSYTMKVFKRLADEVPDAHVMYCNGYQYGANTPPPGSDVYWVRDIYENVKIIPKDQLVKGTSYGYTFQTYTLDTPRYLKWLVNTLYRLGGSMERDSFESIQEVIEKYSADIVINCTAMGSRHLKDVLDMNMYSLRGQTVLVNAPHIRTQHYIDGKGVFTYIIPRGDGTVICGGTMDPNNHNTQPDDAVTKSILERVYELHPAITHGKGPDAFDVLLVNVGFRPSRKGGIRIEKETRYHSNGQKVIVCHNYGHSSHGYQSSWGSSAKVIELLSQSKL
ncbi:hypothetical protein BDB01DRAFT_771046 [Pilobolus umbonatus]|nr:hypothetical protein BDB01DRAFT_771046 [Pilobolus umbonatus]